uniref:DNA helicase Pif1-like 2B domain-containing protein n=1 Tax=Trichogramma kaykai TaxID=54128 RepID=A0ABD2WDR2_9HYME
MIKFGVDVNSERGIDNICELLPKLPLDAVCLLPNLEMCDAINQAMLSKIDSPEILLEAEDNFNCPQYFRKRINKILKDDNNTNVNVGVARTIILKIGSKAMLRRNIDISIGLVNGAIGIITTIVKDAKHRVEQIKIRLISGEEHSISRMDYKFVLMDNIYINRKQFPLCLSDGITIHKSQGLSFW